SSTARATSCATRSHACLIGVRKRTRSLPTAVASGTAPSTFPQSNTGLPRPSIRSASPAYRIAEGPMSTPRRPAPRSRLAPIRAIGRPSACPRTQRKLPLLGVAVVALTGDEAPKLHEAVKEAGADGVLMKSELVDVLVERLAGLRPSG